MTNYHSPKFFVLSRKPAATRLHEVSLAAINLLIQRGYAGFRLAELAASMGLTEAALYRYVEGKDALVHAALLVACYPDEALTTEALPMRAHTRLASAAVIERFFEEHSPLVTLRKTLRSRKPIVRPAEEIAAFAVTLYQNLSRFRQAIRLIERLAGEWPELQALWFENTRVAFFADLERFLAPRLRSGIDKTTAAAVLVETVNYFAVSRAYEKFPAPIAEPMLEETIAALFSGTLGAR